MDIAGPMCGSNEEIEAYTQWLYVHAQMLVDRPHTWNAITLLAEKLCADMTVDGKTVRQSTGIRQGRQLQSMGRLASRDRGLRTRLAFPYQDFTCPIIAFTRTR